MCPPLPFRNPHENQRQKPVWCSMAARSADLRWLTALILLAWPAMAAAQSLPRQFQYRQERLMADGNTCIDLIEAKIQGDFVLLAPLTGDCTNRTDEFAADEGFVFPLNGKDQHSRDCRIPKGENPVMTCSDGEVSTVRAFTAIEPFSLDSTISHSASWNGSRLAISQDDFQTRFTMAGGSGTKPLKERLVYYLEFSFSGNQCVLEKVKRSRIVNGRNQVIASVEGLSCAVVR